ncbi:MAG TPA: hypothetical protein PKC70_06800 [Cellvibrionaceae bacterium]|nr:hypothetical protein [Cellvibrionaceae bacterium]
MFTKEDVVLFSRVQGRVLFNGVPVAKAKVIRRYRYDTPEPLEDSCVTNDDGLFELPAIIKKNTSVTPLVQFVVHQQIFVVRDGVEQQIWSHGKMIKEENSEYGGEFKTISCELSQDLKRVKVGIVDFVFTNCVW